MKALLLAAALLHYSVVHASDLIKHPTSTECDRWMLWKEARGEGEVTQRAVLDVLDNRVRLYKKAPCSILEAKGQYPYFKEGVYTTNSKFIVRHSKIRSKRKVLSGCFIYFNNKPFKWGTSHRKIGGLWFSKIEGGKYGC